MTFSIEFLLNYIVHIFSHFRHRTFVQRFVADTKGPKWKQKHFEFLLSCLSLGVANRVLIHMIIN